MGKTTVRPEDVLKLWDQNVVGGDFSDRRLLKFHTMRSRFERCKFERLRVEDATFGSGPTQSVYVECSFDGSRLRAPSPGNARFERCTFRDVRLSGFFAFQLEFVDCLFTGRAEKCVFNGAPLERRRRDVGREVNEFSGNDFSGMELRDVGFRTGVDLTKQRLPTGPPYVYLPHAEVEIARVRAVVSRWADDGARSDALALLRWLEGEAKGDQEQLFLQRPRRSDPTMTKVLDLLDADDAVQA